jgi:hypothetical protein
LVAVLAEVPMVADVDPGPDVDVPTPPVPAAVDPVAELPRALAATVVELPPFEEPCAAVAVDDAPDPWVVPWQAMPATAIRAAATAGARRG